MQCLAMPCRAMNSQAAKANRSPWKKSVANRIVGRLRVGTANVGPGISRETERRRDPSRLSRFPGSEGFLTLEERDFLFSVIDPAGDD
jgi:hypothetical protein